MACLYCGKEVPFRMRLTGNVKFCCPAHKESYNDEHSRLGLARLLEEVAPVAETPKKPVVEEVGSGLESEPDTEPVDALPEPELVASGRGLALWVFPHMNHGLEPEFAQFTKLDFPPAEYVPGGKLEPPVPKPAPNISANVSNASRSRGETPAPASTAERAPNRAKPPGMEAAASPVPNQSHLQSPPRKESPVQPTSRSPERTAKASDGELPKADPPSKTSVVTDQPERDKKVDFEFSGYDATPRSNDETRGVQKIAAGIVLAICLGAGGYLGLGVGGGDDLGVTGGGKDEAVAQTWGEWIPDWSEGEHGEAIALFGPSQEWADYKVEWDAESDSGVSWVFRAVNPDNYYVVRLSPDSSGDLKVVHYAIIDGVRNSESELPVLDKSNGGENFTVELEVKGYSYTLYVAGHSVADWTDDRLTGGGFGIIRPGAGLAGVNDVKVTQLDRNSAYQRGRFWKGMPPGRLPEVTLIGRHPSRVSSAEESTQESSL